MIYLQTLEGLAGKEFKKNSVIYYTGEYIERYLNIDAAQIVHPGSLDYWDYGSSYPCLVCGGVYSNSENLGLFYVAGTVASVAPSNVGFRVIVLP